MVFSKQEYWSDLPCPPPGHLPNPGIKPSSLALQADPLPSEPTFYYSVTITWYFSVPLPPFYMYIWITFLLNILKKFLNINQNKCSNIKKNLIAILVEVRNNWLLYRQWHPTPVLCLENPMNGGAWWAAVDEVARVGHDWATSLSLFTFMHWRRKWQPTPVFLPGESQGRGSLVGSRLCSRTESDTTEVT